MLPSFLLLSITGRQTTSIYKYVGLIILTPTVPSPAFPHGAKSDDLIAMYRNDVLTVPASLAGLPSISVPAGLCSKGLPLGLQIITKAFDEATLFKIAHALESSAKFTAKPV